MQFKLTANVKFFYSLFSFLFHDYYVNFVRGRVNFYVCSWLLKMVQRYVKGIADFTDY